MRKPVGAWATNYILTLGSWLVTGVLLLLAARRWLFVLAALLPDRGSTEPAQARPAPLPYVLLLVPVRNEAGALPGLLPALDRLDYPGDRLTVVFINDGSTDGSEALLQSWVENKDNWRVLSLPQNQGKARALNAALAAFSQGEIVAVYDADERPLPAALRTLVRPFGSARVGGVSGRRAVSNPLASPAASYITLEGLVHQLVTMQAKDRLNLGPALLGANCAYRRSALAEVGNFKPGALLEDSDLTLKLSRAGWAIHFAPEAISYHRVPETISGYWRQHTRWARGFNEVAKAQMSALTLDNGLPLALRLELAAFSLGYLDRLALLAGGSLLLLNRRFWRSLALLVALSLLTPLLQVMAALKISREPGPMWARVTWLPFFFLLDIAMAMTSLWKTLRRTPQVWEERGARK